MIKPINYSQCHPFNLYTLSYLIQTQDLPYVKMFLLNLTNSLLTLYRFHINPVTYLYTWLFHINSVTYLYTWCFHIKTVTYLYATKLKCLINSASLFLHGFLYSVSVTVICQKTRVDTNCYIFHILTNPSPCLPESRLVDGFHWLLPTPSRLAGNLHASLA